MRARVDARSHRLFPLWLAESGDRHAVCLQCAYVCVCADPLLQGRGSEPEGRWLAGEESHSISTSLTHCPSFLSSPSHPPTWLWQHTVCGSGHTHTLTNHLQNPSYSLTDLQARSPPPPPPPWHPLLFKCKRMGLVNVRAQINWAVNNVWRQILPRKVKNVQKVKNLAQRRQMN